MAKRLIIFSTYSNEDRFEDYHKHWFEQLSKHGTLKVASNSRNLSPTAIKEIESSEHDFRFFKNQGWDFGQWYNMLNDTDIDEYDELLLCNDSNFLIKSLDPFFDWANRHKAEDVLGMTSSNQINYHLQSFFILYRKPTFEFLKSWFFTHGIITDRQELINTYEVRFSNALREKGFKIRSRVEADQFVEANPIALNPKKAIDLGSPLLKKKTIYNTFKRDEKGFLEYHGYDFNQDWKSYIIENSDFNAKIFLKKPIVNVNQVYYKDSQKPEMLEMTLPYKNDSITPYFENMLLKEFYEQDKIVGDYWGLLSWKFQAKNNCWLEYHHIDGRHDMYVAPLDMLNRKHDVMKDSNHCHPGFEHLFKIVLTNLGIGNGYRAYTGIYQNAVIARPEIWKDYVKNYLKPTIEFLENSGNKVWNKRLWSDAKYSFNPELRKKFMKSFGVPHYTFHTFLCERLWSWYYELNKKNIDLKFLPQTEKPEEKIPAKFKQRKSLVLFALFDEQNLRPFLDYCEPRSGSKITWNRKKYPNKVGLREAVDDISEIMNLNRDTILYHSNLAFDWFELYREFFDCKMILFIPENPQMAIKNYKEKVENLKKNHEVYQIDPRKDFKMSKKINV